MVRDEQVTKDEPRVAHSCEVPGATKSTGTESRRVAGGWAGGGGALLGTAFQSGPMRTFWRWMWRWYSEDVLNATELHPKNGSDSNLYVT